jgi:Ca-activated chloride channel family protein
MHITRGHQIKRLVFPFSRRATACITLLLAFTLSLPAAAGSSPQEKKTQQKPQESQRDKEQRDQNSRDQNSPDQDDPVRLRTDLIVVNLTVTDANGHYAHGLSLNDFVLLEDDTRQTLDSLAKEEAPFAAAILIDMSGSMEYRFGLVRGAAASFVEHIRDNDQIAVYGFNNKVRQFQDFTNARDISEYIWDAKAEDMTRLYDGMDEAITALAARSEKRKTILLITDGCDTTSSKASRDSVMKKALASGITIYSIDLIDDNTLMGSGSMSTSLRRGRSEMKDFSTQTGGRYIHSPQGDKLEESFIDIVDELRNQYTLTYYSTNAKRDGRYRKINVGVSRAGMSVRARRGYWAAK